MIQLLRSGARERSNCLFLGVGGVWVGSGLNTGFGGVHCSFFWMTAAKAMDEDRGSGFWVFFFDITEIVAQREAYHFSP